MNTFLVKIKCKKMHIKCFDNSFESLIRAFALKTLKICNEKLCITKDTCIDSCILDVIYEFTV